MDYTHKIYKQNSLDFTLTYLNNPFPVFFFILIDHGLACQISLEISLDAELLFSQIYKVHPAKDYLPECQPPEAWIFKA